MSWSLGSMCPGRAATRLRVGRRSLETLDQVPVETRLWTRLALLSLTGDKHPCRVPASPGMAAPGRMGGGSGVGGGGGALPGPALSRHSDGRRRDPFPGRSGGSGVHSRIRWARGASSRKPLHWTQEGLNACGPPAAPPMRASWAQPQPALCMEGCREWAPFTYFK